MSKRKKYLAFSCIFFALGLFVLCYAIMMLFDRHVNVLLIGRVILALLICVFAYCGCRSLLYSYPYKKEEIRKSLLIICLGVYLGLLAILLLFYYGFGRGLQCIFMVGDVERAVYINHCVNLIPGRTIAFYLKMNANMRYVVINLLGNLAVLTPFGILLPYLVPALKKTVFYIMAVIGISMIIEGLQLIFMCGSADVDDVILNSLGSVAFYLMVNHTKLQKLIQHILWAD